MRCYSIHLSLLTRYFARSEWYISNWKGNISLIHIEDFNFQVLKSSMFTEFKYISDVYEHTKAVRPNVYHATSQMIVRSLLEHLRSYSVGMAIFRMAQWVWLLQQTPVGAGAGVCVSALYESIVMRKSYSLRAFFETINVIAQKINISIFKIITETLWLIYF